MRVVPAVDTPDSPTTLRPKKALAPLPRSADAEPRGDPFSPKGLPNRPLASVSGSRRPRESVSVFQLHDEDGPTFDSVTLAQPSLRYVPQRSVDADAEPQKFFKAQQEARALENGFSKKYLDRARGLSRFAGAMLSLFFVGITVMYITGSEEITTIFWALNGYLMLVSLFFYYYTRSHHYFERPAMLVYLLCALSLGFLGYIIVSKTSDVTDRGVFCLLFVTLTLTMTPPYLSPQAHLHHPALY